MKKYILSLALLFAGSTIANIEILKECSAKANITEEQKQTLITCVKGKWDENKSTWAQTLKNKVNAFREAAPAKWNEAKETVRGSVKSRWNRFTGWLNGTQAQNDSANTLKRIESEKPVTVLDA